MSLILRFVLGFAVLLGLSVSPATAGSSALMLRDATLMSGPGAIYNAGGTAVAASRIDVESCRGYWCRITVGGQSGWVEARDITFGQEAREWFTGPHFDTKSGSGTACFYTGAGFSGQSFCQPSGGVIRDLALARRDNAIGSVKITGNASVIVCRDRFFSSYCELLTGDTPHLSKLLAGEISSIRVY